MEIGLFMTSVFFIAIISGVVSYRVSITTARHEIDDAFKEHLGAMHQSHQELVKSIESDQEG